MPQLRKLTVHVTDAGGQEFQEWGIQLLPRWNKISAYIESRSNVAFKITVQAEIPYVGHLLPHTESGASSGTQKNVEHPHRTGSGSQKAPDSKEVPPFHFLVSLYLDGRQKAERRKFIVLDPNHAHYKHGKARLDSRLVLAEDGTIHRHTFVFSEIGIDTILGQLALSTGSEQAEDVDAITAAMDSAVLDSKKDLEKEEKQGAGQIKVVIERITLPDRSVNSDYDLFHQEGEKEDADMTGTGSALTHTIGLSTNTKTRVSKHMRAYEYEPYGGGRLPFATFIFFYRSHETLERLFSNGPRPSEKPRRTHEPADAQYMNEVSFLSTTRDSRAKSKPARREGNAYEDRVRNRSFPDAPKTESANWLDRPIEAAVEAQLQSRSSSGVKTAEAPEEDKDAKELRRGIGRLTLKRQRGSDDEGDSGNEGESKEGGAPETAGPTEKGGDESKEEDKSEPASKRAKKQL